MVNVDREKCVGCHKVIDFLLDLVKVVKYFGKCIVNII